MSPLQRRPVTADAFRACMRLFPTGVAVLTAGRGESAVGMTVNAVMSTSLDPPLLAVGVHARARVVATVDRERTFALCLLAGHQEHVARAFAHADRPGGWALVDLCRGRSGDNGAPLLPEVLSAVECTVSSTYPSGDHVLFLAEVTAIHPGADHMPPLVFHHGRLGCQIHPTPADGQAGAASPTSSRRVT